MADTVAVIVQPGSGDVLQFLKAGIMEIPDVLVVTKADLGDIALRARRDLHAALRSRRRARHAGRRGVVGRAGRRAIDELVAALDAHRERARPRRAPRRRAPRTARWPTSSPSTASAACARSAAAAPRRRWLAEQEPGARRARAAWPALEDRAARAAAGA